MSFVRRLFGKRLEDTRSQVPSAACPYCGVVLEPAPERSRKCPDCKERVVVRTRWWHDRAKLLLTEAEAQEFDKESERQSERRSYLQRAEGIGAEEVDFERVEGEQMEKWGRAAPRDVFWELANRAALEAMRQGDWNRLSTIYWQQALLLFDDGKEHVRIQREASKAGLRRYEEQGVRHVEILAGDCTVCKPNNGRRFSVSDALEQLPIPNEQCEKGWCRCIWTPAID